MLFSRLTEYGTRLIIALILGLALIGSLPLPAKAQSSVDLQLGGEGATSWNIDNINPGDSGTKTIELHNAGSSPGSVTIWITDIEETDYGGDGTPLDDYLLFNLSGERLSSNITLPATIHALPQSSTDTNYINIETLSAGETITLVWTWAFPETGELQNDAQGDSLSFTINYLLEELPNGSDVVEAPNYQKLEIDILGKLTVAKVSSSGKFLYACTATDPDNKRSLKFAKGTRVTSVDGEVPRRIEMRPCETPPPPPDGMEMLGPAYNLTGYISDSEPCSLIFDKPVEFTLSYEPDWLPESTLSILIASYDPGHGWTELESNYNGIAQVSAVTAIISHASIYALFAGITPPPLPAQCGLSELAINPAQTEVGEPVTISAIAQNTGGLESSYTLALRINGLIEQSQEITLATGESKQLSFTVIKDEPGTYAITLGSLTGEFIVLAPSFSLPEDGFQSEGGFHWWVILLIAGSTASVVYCLVLRLKRHS